MFKIGDKVRLRGIVSGKDINGSSGTISDEDNESLTTNIDSNGNIVGNHYYRGIIYFIKEIYWWVAPQNIVGYENRKLKKIENPELDPYGEEDWGYIQENSSEYIKVGDIVSYKGETGVVVWKEDDLYLMNNRAGRRSFYCNSRRLLQSGNHFYVPLNLIYVTDAIMTEEGEPPGPKDFLLMVKIIDIGM